MKRQVIQNVLDLPGISGMALIDGRNRPFFFGQDISLNSQQQDALAQGIQQVIETTPAHFKTFTFRFTSQLTHIYKLEQGLILLVLVGDHLALTEYRTAIDQLKAALVEAPQNAVATLRLLAGCVTLSNRATPPEVAPPLSPTPMADDAADPPGPETSTVKPGTLSPGSQEVSYQDILAAMNHLSDGAVQYLGKTIVLNTWNQARPAHPWLEQFELQKDGHFTVRQGSQTPLTVEQQRWIKDWVTSFLGRGGRTFRNFQALVSSQTLTPAEQQLLLEAPPGEH